MRFLRAISLSAVTVLFALSALLHAQASDPAVVKSESGSVRGAAKNGVISWKGIPYRGARCEHLGDQGKSTTARSLRTFSTRKRRADANYFTVDGVSANFGRTLEQTKKSE